MRTFQTTNKVRALTGTKKPICSLSMSLAVNVNSYWSEGARETFRVINIYTKTDFTPPPGSFPWTTPNDYTLTHGDIVINSESYRGKDMAPHFYCRPGDIAVVKTFLEIDK